MDYISIIKQVYDHIENGYVDKAVMGCLRISRYLKDYLYSAIFLREMYPNKGEIQRTLYDETKHLNEDARKFFLTKSFDDWLDLHTLDFSPNPIDKDKNILMLGVGELDSEIEQCERSIRDMVIPSNMGEYDTAAFTDRYNNQKANLRLRISAIQVIKERIKSRCLNYIIRIEQQLETQGKTQTFLEEVQTEVNNYFIAHSEDVYIKLQKATQLVGSTNTEDLSLLLTQVRRTLKGAADYFYPPSDQRVICSDGQERILGDAQYMNRLQEFLMRHIKKSSSCDLLYSEFEKLAVFARRLNDVASKGVHDTVSVSEAKQGLIGLYFFLYNVCSHLQIKSS